MDKGNYYVTLLSKPVVQNTDEIGQYEFPKEGGIIKEVKKRVIALCELCRNKKVLTKFLNILMLATT